MKKALFLFVLAVAAILFATASRKSTEVPKEEIAQFCKTSIPGLKPLQMECCVGEELVAYGARCVIGKQACVENPCPSGSSECGSY